MNRRIWLAAGIWGAALPLRAAQYEVTPSWGYRYSTGVDIRGPEFNRLDVKDDHLIGLSVGFLNSDNGQLDLSWSRSKTRVEARRADGSDPDAFDVRIDRYFINGLSMTRRGPIQPFLLMGLGTTRYGPAIDRSAEWRLSFALGTGVKWLLTDRLGVRLDARWAPDVVLGKSDFFCDDSGDGGCYEAEPTKLFHGAVHLIHHGEFTTGLMLRF